MHRSVVLVAVVLLAIGAHCYPVSDSSKSRPEKTEIRPAPTVNRYMKSLHRCLSLHTPLDCCGLEECNIRGMVGLVERVNDTEGTINAFNLQFNTTVLSNIERRDRNRGAAVYQFVEIRVHKKALSNRTIATLESAGCNTSRIVVRIQAASAETGKYIISESILSTQQLRSNEWISFRNVDQLYDIWMNDNYRTMQTIKLDVHAHCGAIQSAFAPGDGEGFAPIMVAYMNTSQTAFIRLHRRDARLNVQRRQVLSQNISCNIFPYTVNLSEYIRDVILPLETTINFCMGSCDSAPTNYLKINSWIHRNELAKNPNSLPPLCCAPSLYRPIVIIEQEENVLFAKTIFNFNAGSCDCV